LQLICSQDSYSWITVLILFVKELLHGDVGKAIGTPLKSTPAKKHYFAGHSRRKESHPQISSSFFHLLEKQPGNLHGKL